MTLSDFATFSTAISGLAVTASLIYLAMQTHQSVKHARAMVHQGRASRIVAQLSSQLTPDVAVAIIEGNGGVATPEAVKQHIFGTVCTAYFVSFDDSFEQYRYGLLDGASLRLVKRNVQRVFSQSGVRSRWDQYKDPDSEFTLFVEDVLSAISIKK